MQENRGLFPRARELSCGSAGKDISDMAGRSSARGKDIVIILEKMDGRCEIGPQGS